MSDEQPTAALFSTVFLNYSQTFIYDEVRAHRRYRVEVFARDRKNRERFPYPHVHTLNEAKGEDQPAWRRGPEAWMYSSLRWSPRFSRALTKLAPRVVHGHFGPGAIYAAPFAKKLDVPLLVSFHGYDVPLLRDPLRWLPKNLRYARRAPHLLEQMTLGLCASNDLKELLVEIGVPESKLRTHRLGIDLSKFTPAPRAPDPVQVVMVGRFVEKKGFEYAIRAFAQATRASQSNARLVIIGDGPRRERLEALVGDCEIAGTVKFTGALPAEAVAAQLQQSHILLAPSVTAANGDRESGVIVIKEASASEVVPIGTWHGGIPEIIDDGQTGFLVQERDTEALAHRLSQLMSDHALRERMGRAARAKMEAEYDLFERVDALADTYDEAAELYRRGP